MAISLSRALSFATRPAIGDALHRVPNATIAHTSRVSHIAQKALRRPVQVNASYRKLSSKAPSNNLGGKKVSSVSSGADNGANNCMANRLGSMRHDTTGKAVDNLLSKLQAAAQDARMVLGAPEDVYEFGNGQPFLGGHGDDGFLTTGAGQNDPQTYKNTMGTWNEFEWGPHFDRLRDRNYVILSILSCNTGAGQDGADLLFSIAQRTNHTVRARTGLTSCGSGGITFEAGSSWQVATPTHKPSPIPAPSHFRSLTAGTISIRDDSGLKSINPSQVSKVLITGFASYTRAESEVELDQNEAILNLLKNIDFKPVTFGPGSNEALMGMITSEITLVIDALGITKKFYVYNNSVLQDATYPDIYYRAMPGFKGLMSHLT